MIFHKKNDIKKIAVGLSGGVDSATSAYLLQKAGYEVFGITMKIFNDIEVESAKKVAKILGIKHYVVDYSEYFEKEIIDKFIQRYLQGETPNPCIMCNIKLKYKKLLQDALKLGADAIAYGHYASIDYDESDDCYHLYKANAKRKDQSYVLYHLQQDQLEKVILPLNTFESKEKVREILKEQGIAVAEKKDSVGICFTKGKSLHDYMKEKMPGIDFCGEFVDESANVLGKHKGIFCYTIGQKRGLGLGENLVYYVSHIDARKNQVVLTQAEEELYKKEIYVKEVTFTQDKYRNWEKIDMVVKICQWGYELPAVLYVKEMRVEFLEPQRGPTKGQSAVFYIGDEVIGGGVIL